MTSPYSHDPFDDRRAGLEQEYFRTKDAALVAKLKAVFEDKRNKEELRAATGITNEEVLDRLVAVNVRGEMLTVFKLYPLVEIAWADGAVDERERQAIIDAAISTGVPKDGAGIERLQEWISRGPNDDARAVWKTYASELRKTLSAEELATFRHDLLTYSKRVAEASGGYLGIIFQISPAERRVLDELANLLT